MEAGVDPPHPRSCPQPFCSNFWRNPLKLQVSSCHVCDYTRCPENEGPGLLSSHQPRAPPASLRSRMWSSRPRRLERSKVLSRAGPRTHCSLSSAGLAEHRSHVASPGQSFIPPGWPHPGSGRRRHPGDAELKARVSCARWCPSPAHTCAPHLPALGARGAPSVC